MSDGAVKPHHVKEEGRTEKGDAAAPDETPVHADTVMQLSVAKKTMWIFEWRVVCPLMTQRLHCKLSIYS